MRNSPGSRINLLDLGRAILLAEFVYFVLSNAAGLHEVLPVAGKHALFVALAGLSLTSWPVQSIKAATLSLPIVAVYFVGQAWVFGAMVLVLALSMPIVTRVVLDIIVNRRMRTMWLLIAITFVPLVINADLIVDKGLFDTTYGRPRALLGYWHPKDGGVAFAVPALMLIIMLERRIWTVALAAGAFIWMVGSRNVALIMVFAAAVRCYPRAVLLVASASLAGVAIWFALEPNLYDTLDTLLSLRLTNWQDALSDSGQTAGLDVLGGDRFAVDNFFIEGFIYAGPLVILLSIVWIAMACVVARRAKALRPWPSVAVVLLVLFANFDSGIASTGNLLHVLLWSLIASPIVLRPREASALAQQRNHRLSKRKTRVDRPPGDQVGVA